MGNPFTCTWTVVHFTLVEHLLLEIRHKTNVAVLVRFTDYVLMTWKEKQATAQ